jgi:guanylate kinase
VDKKDFIKWAKKLAETYQPSREVLEKLAKIDIIALVGPTGVGKSSIIHKTDLPFVRSDVTRPARPDEKNNKDYFFRNDYLEILKDIKTGKYVQFLIAKNDEFYGTRVDSYPNSGACVMAIVASEIPHFRKLGFRQIKPVYIMPPSYVEWMRRIGGVRSEDLLARIEEAKESLSLALSDNNYQFLLNDDLDHAVSDLESVASGETLTGRRTDLAKATADILLERIGITDLGL